MPVVNREKFEGKVKCIAVCTYDVFALDILPPQDRVALSFVGRLKGKAPGWKQAFPVNAEACRACAECVASCPEKSHYLETRTCCLNQSTFQKIFTLRNASTCAA